MWLHMVTHRRGSEGETGKWSGNTPRLPVVDWTDAPTDLNGLVHFAERRNLASERVPSHFNWPQLVFCSTWQMQAIWSVVDPLWPNPHCSALVIFKYTYIYIYMELSLRDVSDNTEHSCWQWYSMVITNQIVHPLSHSFHCCKKFSLFWTEEICLHMSEHALLPAWISFLVTWSTTRNYLDRQSLLWTFQQTLHKRVYTLYSTLWVLNIHLLVFLCRHKYCLKCQYPFNQFPSPHTHTHTQTYILLRKYFLRGVTIRENNLVLRHPVVHSIQAKWKQNVSTLTDVFCFHFVWIRKNF